MALIKLTAADVAVLHSFAILARTLKLSKTHFEETRERMTALSNQHHELIHLVVGTSNKDIDADGMTRKELDALLDTVGGHF